MEPMQITINGTKVTIVGNRIIGFQLNNLVNRFEATTDKDDSWQYTLYAVSYTHLTLPTIRLV